MFAALGAAGQDAKTVLVEQHAFVGGQGTAGGVHTFCGETRLVNNPWRLMLSRLKELGGIEEYSSTRDGRRFEIEALKFVLQEMLIEAGVELLLHTSLVDVERIGDSISSFILFNKTGFCRLNCMQAIDATGEADLVHRAGWATLKGGAVLAPGDPPTVDHDAGSLQLPMSLYFTLLNTHQPVTPYLPDGCPKWDSDENLPMTTVTADGITAVVKMKVIGHDASDGGSLSHSEMAARRQMMGLVHYLQTKGYGGAKYDTYTLGWVAPHIGIREGRRVSAIYEMSVDDLFRGRHFDDAIGVGSYHVDYHWPTVVQRAGTGVTTQCPPYQIPLRALRPMGSSNVLAAGRSVSGEQLAMSSFRVMGTCAQTGFGAGVAAGIAVSKGGSLDGLEIPKLQSVLRQNGVRFDLAPYNHRRTLGGASTNYLRAKRGSVESIASNGATTILSTSLALLPSGDQVCAWVESDNNGWHLNTAIQSEADWCEPSLIHRSTDDAPASVLLWLADSRRMFAEGIEEHFDSGQSVEQDEPPALYLYAGKTGWRSDDGSGSWCVMDFGIELRSRPLIIEDGSSIALASLNGRLVTATATSDSDTWEIGSALNLPPADLNHASLWRSDGATRGICWSGDGTTACWIESRDEGKSWVVSKRQERFGLILDVAKLLLSPNDPPTLVMASVRDGVVQVAASYDDGETWPNTFALDDANESIGSVSLVATADGYAVSYALCQNGISVQRRSPEHLLGRAHPSVGHGGSPDWISVMSKTAETAAK